MVVLRHQQTQMEDLTMKNRFKILITEDANEFCREDQNIFAKQNFEAKFCTKDGSKVIEMINEWEPDIVLTDMFMTNIDAVGVIRHIRSKAAKSPVFVTISNFDSPVLEHEALSAGAAYYVIKPYRPENLLERIKDLLTYCTEEPEQTTQGEILTIDKDLEITVTDILHQIGVPAHIKGYQYLRDSILLCVRRPEIINAVTKELYPAVANKYETTPSRVERAIRHAIEVAWDRGDVDILNSYFGYTIHNGRGKPTNSEFIAMISDRLRLHNKRSA